MTILAVGNGEARVAIDGKKLLKALNLTEEQLKESNGSELICKALLNLSDSEREIIFNQCKMTTSELRDQIFNENEEEFFKEKSHSYSFRLASDCYDTSDIMPRASTTIKKELKHCSNYMQRKALEKELQKAYKYEKTGYCY